jgi:hypothetical protein
MKDYVIYLNLYMRHILYVFVRAFSANWSFTHSVYVIVSGYVVRSVVWITEAYFIDLRI